MAGRTKKTGRNIAFNFANQIAVLILAFLSRTVFVKTLGIDYLGLDGVFSSVLKMITMADLGIQTAMVYSFYKPLAEKDHNKLAALTTYYRKVYLVIAGTVAAIGLMLIPALPYVINLDREVPHLTLYYLLSLSNVVVSYLCVYRTSILTADQKGYMISRVNIWINLIKTALQIGAVLLFRSYFAYLLIGILGGISQNVIASRLAVKEYPFIQKRAELDAAEKKQIFADIRPVILYKLSSVAQDATDNLLTSVMIGTVVVGYYSNYFMIQSRIVGLVALLFASMTASVGNLVIEEKAEKRYEVFLGAQSVGLIITAVLVPCYFVLINGFIELWFGKDYLLPLPIVAATAVNMFFSCVQRPLWSFTNAVGLYRRTKYAKLACAVLNVALSILMGKFLGLAGILFASAISALVTYVWYEPKLIFRDYFEMPVSGFYKDMALSFLLVSALSVLCGFVTGRIPGAGILIWILKAVICAAICGTAALLCYGRTAGFGLFLEKLKRLLRGEE